MPQLTRMFTWHEQFGTLPNLFGQRWANFQTQDPEGQADAISTGFLTTLPLDVENRCVGMFGPSGALLNHTIKERDLKAFLVNGIDITESLNTGTTPEYNEGYLVRPNWSGADGIGLIPFDEWADRFFARLKTNGCEIGCFHNDDESLVNIFQVATSEDRTYFQSVWEDEDVQAVIPSFLQGYEWDDALDTFDGRRLFHRWTGMIKASSMVRTMGQFAIKHFGRMPQITNYGDNLTPYPYFDPGLTHAQFDGFATNGVSAPIFYQGWIDPDQEATTPADDHAWRFFVNDINGLRGALEVGEVVPWVPPPTWYRASNGVESYNAPPEVVFLQEERLRHARYNGVKDFFFWNPHNGITAAHEALVARHANRVVQPRKVLPQLSLTVDEVVTGPVKTTYAAYLAHRAA